MQTYEVAMYWLQILSPTRIIGMSQFVKTIILNDDKYQLFLAGSLGNLSKEKTPISMQRILFPTDFSDAANHAFSYALRVAQVLNAKIIVFHAYEMPSLGRALPHTLAEFYESIKLEEFKNYEDNIPVLEKVAKELNLTEINVQYVMEGGIPKSAIIRQAKKDAVDLIIMGTTGASGFKEVFLGSVAGEVMENA
ncbi:MAG: universal stress protein, partial [Bacteroidota bacterium]